MRNPLIDFDDAEPAAPVPMTDEQAAQLARKMFRRGATQRRGRACIVGRRPKPYARTIEPLGTGATWERAFDVALVNLGR